jgi:hypothetical protein
MTFLPIVERELRVAARRRLTFWLRVAAALTAFVVAGGLLVLFLNIPSGMGAQPGGPLFAVLTWMSLAVSLAAGLFFTSDALSEEKREGTLGFLFLTDLRGYDVVLGKLLATSCRCVFALLAIFPVLAGTQLLGGVEGGQFWRVILALLHTLFFSLTVGIFISSISRHPQKALAGTLVLLFISVGGGATADALWAWLNDKNFRPLLSLASPITVFLHADGNLSLFWRALLVSEGVAWGLLAAACFLIPRTWQEKAARLASVNSPWRTWWRWGGERRRQHLRLVVLNRNPLTWLACRERWQSLLLWAMALVVFGWFMAVSLLEDIFLGWMGWGVVSTLATLTLYLWTASQASQVFAEMQRAGLIELLLAAPLDFRKVAPGAWWGLVRLFGVPIGILLLVQFVAGVSGASPGGVVFGGLSGLLPEWVITWGRAVAGLVVGVANFVALIWFGLWMGLVSRNGLLATLKTMAFVQIIPWLVITFAGWMVIPLMALFSGGFRGGPGAGNWFEWYPIISMVMVTTLTLAKDWLFWALARRKIVEDFRATATRAIVPASYAKGFGAVVPASPGVPPVIPLRPIT